MGGFPSGYPCEALTSDTDAVYCAEDTGSNVRLASDGTATLLGATSGSSYITFDDTYVYWVDRTTVGTIKRAPKGGGGTATILAHDTDPTAIAVDATSIYWTDMGGFIKSIPNDRLRLRAGTTAPMEGAVQTPPATPSRLRVASDP